MNSLSDANPMPAVAQNRLIKRADAAGEQEICGFITNDWEIHPIHNSADDPKEDFLMHSEDIRDFLRNRWQDILGMYHSHPYGDKNGPKPSQSDVENYPGHGWRYFILYDGNVHEWNIDVQDGLVTEVGYPDFYRVAH